ncbi:YfjI family protein [Pseudomonas sp. SL4(2022)]|uniref:YfjI family protein n=1 Tax=Pseudomonas sp. SL4(2022) TaxID=2994661 RepID=UPI002271941D|nr:YfjI family protein [Pseudomonas sp. SL4(2022)]WAC45397.1 YfjI family protein [Pseudomonas sp. SL4(2022)]
MSYTSSRDLPELPRQGLFPVLSAHCQRLNAAINQVEDNIQAPKPLILMSALSAIAVSAQWIADVQKPTEQVVPISLMLCVIANSGERKTTVENVFMKAIRNYQNEQERIYQVALEEWQVLHAAWEARRQAILSVIKKKAVSGVCMAEDEQLLLELERKRPARPKKPQFVYDETTREALYYGLHKNIPTAGIIQGEGGLITKGRAFADRERMSAMWSGSPISVERKSAESFRIENPRLTVSMMLQESAMHEYMKRDGEQARGTGLLARFLTCYPASTQGARFLRNGTQSWEHCDKFAERVTELLKQNTQIFLGERDRIVIQCDPEARAWWLWVFNSIEEQISPGGRFDKAGDHASKLPENILRVAALLHIFEGFEGHISLATLKAAASICFYCSDEFMRLFVPRPQEQVDADKLFTWLQGFRSKGYRYIPKNYALQRLGSIKKVERLDLALNVLLGKGVIAPHIHGRKELIDMQPHLPVDPISAQFAAQARGAM